jgi:murein hydrolase activator
VVKWSQAGLVGRRVCSSFRTRLWAHALVVGTMATALLVFGAFMVTNENLQILFNKWGDQLWINAYLDKALSPAEITLLQDRIESFPEVERVHYISQAQAWKDFHAALGSQSTLLEGLSQDALPPSFEIFVKPFHWDGPLVEALASRLRKEKGLTTVEYPQELVDRISLGILIVGWAKWAIGAILFVITFLIVGSVVRLGIAARKDEIEILQWLGASEELIQAPFVVEGLIQGISAAGLSLLCLWTLLLLLRDQLSIPFGFFGSSGQLQFIDWRGVALIVAMGGLLGASGSLFSLRRFMQTWKKMRRKTVFCLLASLLFCPGRLDAASAKDLEGIKQRIAKENQGLRQLKKREGSVLQALNKIDRDLEKKTKALNTASSKLAAIRIEINKQEVENERLALSLYERRKLLIQRAVAIYRWQRGQTPSVGLDSGLSLGVLPRRNHYLAATVSFDQELIQQLGDELGHQAKIRGELGQRKEELDGQRRALGQLRDSVRQEAEGKKRLLASLTQEKDSRVRALKELEQAALRLQKMMDEMSRRAVSKPPDVLGSGGLEAMRGKLDWPVRGQIIGGFGKTKHREFSAEVFRNGIDIEAPMGEHIRAVEKGRVVFAERFTGYGRMIIVDHGERYFSVYAHLSEILKKDGSQVSRGETLGRVGDSDSPAGAKLYFEMRKDGKSIDPLPWFRK